MNSRESRLKASDIFENTNHFIAKKGTFADAFPGIEELCVEVEIDEGFGGGKKQIYSKQTLPGEHIDCIHPLCFNGGFSIGFILREMVRKRESDRKGSVICRGYEGSPKGRNKYRDCANMFRFSIHVDYKSSENEAPHHTDDVSGGSRS